MTSESHQVDLYCVGICGTGLANLARFYAAQGFLTAGSDVSTDYYTAEGLKDAGIAVYAGFSRERIRELIPVRVVYSAAYHPESNVELAEARRAGIPVVSYPQAVAELTRQYDTLCVAGSHGKTTTSVMVLQGLKALGITAAGLIGTSVPMPAAADMLVVEACEYRRHFLAYSPRTAVITSMDHDHVDCFPDLSSCEEAFLAFARRAEHTVVLPKYADLGTSAELLVPGERYRAVNRQDGSCLFLPWNISARCAVPGRHIREDALSAVLGICGHMKHRRGRSLTREELERVIQTVCSYQGAVRRFETLGEAGGVLFMDDYAHHPAEISAVIESLREYAPGRRLVVDFVPHTISRTRFFLKEFAGALRKADAVCIQEIYRSRREEDSTDGLSGLDLAHLIENSRFFPDYDGAFHWLHSILQPGDVMLTLGAGDNRQLGFSLLHAMQERNQ